MKNIKTLILFGFLLSVTPNISFAQVSEAKNGVIKTCYFGDAQLNNGSVLIELDSVLIYNLKSRNSSSYFISVNCINSDGNVFISNKSNSSFEIKSNDSKDVKVEYLIYYILQKNSEKMEYVDSQQH